MNEVEVATDRGVRVIVGGWEVYMGVSVAEGSAVGVSGSGGGWVREGTGVAETVKPGDGEGVID
jgi:hypothetical protein